MNIQGIWVNIEIYVIYHDHVSKKKSAQRRNKEITQSLLSASPCFECWHRRLVPSKVSPCPRAVLKVLGATMISKF